MKKYFIWFFIFIQILYQNYLFAQKDSTRILPTAEVIATRFNAFSLGQTQVSSDSQTMRFYSGQSVADFLQAETPLSIKPNGTGIATLAMRGLATNHTAILWNGINIQNPLNGINDLAILDAQSVQQIDVKLGGCSALFGSGAIGGIVQLNDNQSFTNGFHGQFGYGYGSTNWHNKYAQLQFNKDKIGASIKVAAQNADNDFTFLNTAEIGQPLRKAVNAAFNYLNINTSFYWDISEKDKLKIHFWRSQNYREITPTMTAVNVGAVYRDTSNRVVGEWTHFFNHSFLKIRTAYLYDKNFYESNLVKNSQNGIHSSISEAEWNYNFSEKHQIRTGLNVTFDQSDNNNYAATHQRTRLALFVNDVLRTKFIDLTGSLRQEFVNNNTTPTTFSVGFEKNILSPFTPHSSQLILRGSFSRNFNIPTFNDLYWANLGNPNLINEQGWSKELGLSFKRKSDTKLLQAHITFFDIDIKNRIVWLPQIDGQWRPTNLAEVQSRGFETWATYSVRQTNLQYRINASYQFADAQDGDGGAQLYTPQHKGSVSIWGQFKGVYMSWQQTASSLRYATTDRSIWTKPFTLADASVGYTPSVGGLKFDMRLAISNVLNTDYQVIPFFPNPKRQFRLEFMVKF